MLQPFCMHGEVKRRCRCDSAREGVHACRFVFFIQLQTSHAIRARRASVFGKASPRGVPKGVVETHAKREESRATKKKKNVRKETERGGRLGTDGGKEGRPMSGRCSSTDASMSQIRRQFLSGSQTDSSRVRVPPRIAQYARQNAGR